MVITGHQRCKKKLLYLRQTTSKTSTCTQKGLSHRSPPCLNPHLQALAQQMLSNTERQAEIKKKKRKEKKNNVEGGLRQTETRGKK